MGNNKGNCSSTPANNCGSDKNESCGWTSCCIKLIKGALLGGIIMFVYLWASCTLLPIHKATTITYTTAASAAAPAAETSMVDKMKEIGKNIKAAVTNEPAAPAENKGTTQQLAKSFLLCLFNALLLTSLLKKTCAGGGCPVLFSATTGLLVGSVAFLPNLIWFQAPLNYSLLGIADNLIAFTLAGFVLSKFLFNESCTMGKAADKKGSCH
jgi:hypothetical protein